MHTERCHSQTSLMVLNMHMSSLGSLTLVDMPIEVLALCPESAALYVCALAGITAIELASLLREITQVCHSGLRSLISSEQ